MSVLVSFGTPFIGKLVKALREYLVAKVPQWVCFRTDIFRGTQGGSSVWQKALKNCSGGVEGLAISGVAPSATIDIYNIKIQARHSYISQLCSAPPAVLKAEKRAPEEVLKLLHNVLTNNAPFVLFTSVSASSEAATVLASNNIFPR